MKAGVEELLAVDGIGPATADLIRWAVREPAGTYSTYKASADLEGPLI